MLLSPYLQHSNKGNLETFSNTSGRQVEMEVSIKWVVLDALMEMFVEQAYCRVAPTKILAFLL